MCDPPGFTEVMPWQGIPLEEAMPVCECGDVFSVEDIRLVEKQTSPPDYLTESELISLMEKHGIGQSAQLCSAHTSRPPRFFYFLFLLYTFYVIYLLYLFICTVIITHSITTSL